MPWWHEHLEAQTGYLSTTPKSHPDSWKHLNHPFWNAHQLVSLDSGQLVKAAMLGKAEGRTITWRLLGGLGSSFAQAGLPHDSAGHWWYSYSPPPPLAPILTTCLPIGGSLHKEHVEGRWQVSSCFILFVSLVKWHEQVLLHWEGSLYETIRGVSLFLFSFFFFPLVLEIELRILQKC